MFKSKRGPKFKAGKRNKSGRLIYDPNIPPCEKVEQHRALFSFVRPTKGPDGRQGTIDQDICDGIGMLHALGLLDGYGVDPQDMRDKGREWRDLYCKWMRKSGAKAGEFAPRMDGTPTQDLFYADALTERERDRFERLDRNLGSYERSVLLGMLVDPVIATFPDGKLNAPWVEAHVAMGLIERKKLPPLWMQPVRFPDSHDRSLLEAAIRGLAALAGESQRRLAA